MFIVGLQDEIQRWCTCITIRIKVWTKLHAVSNLFPFFLFFFVYRENVHFKVHFIYVKFSSVINKNFVLFMRSDEKKEKKKIHTLCVTQL